MNASFDFDAAVDRRGTASVKWDKYRNKDVIPLWVADMDFVSPPAVLKALQQRVAHGVFGYSQASDALVETLCKALFNRYGWQVQPEWIIWLPGVVTGLNVACRAVGRDHDAVMTTVPVYPPFLSAPGFSGRRLIKVPLKKNAASWGIDFDQLQAAITGQTRLFILCHPHNPVGRVYGRRDLERLLDICIRNDIVICSDEIHCDLILDPAKTHLPLAGLSPEAAKRTITLMAPSKTYNLPGLGCSFAVISDQDLRRQFKRAMAGIVPHVNTMGLVAAQAAYRDGGHWHAALLDYLRGNRDRVAAFVEQQPGLSMTSVEATYLAWIDVRDLGLDKPVEFFEKAGVGLSDGADFDGPGFVRLNFGCPRSLLDKALERMKRAVEKTGHG
jgi:cystathionine beta-lyase